MKKYSLLAGIAALPLLAALSTSTAANATTLPPECVAAPGKVIASPDCLRLIYSDDMLSRGITGVSITRPETPVVDGGTAPVVTPPRGTIPVDNPGRDVDNDDDTPIVIDDKKDDKKDPPKKDEPKKDDKKGYGDKTWNPHTGWDDTKEWTEHDQLYHDAVKGKDKKKKDEVIAEEPKKGEPKKGEPKKGYGDKKQEAPVVDKKGDKKKDTPVVDKKKETPVVEKNDKKKDAPVSDKKGDKKGKEES